ncbi:hypothetical protein HII31_07529 [Pseudocercospora fuligena]|uniref:Glycosyltransferase family 4 protein n=1 Tax=Pseudocercospora fuligena TaxID=685502 RepID=A0A8H6RGL1_9PEZI|nr:hypothetical protein HII31_07529 [Pseudocercospora fuligena]
MSGAAGEELSAGGKRASSPLRLFVDRFEYHALPLVFLLTVAPSGLVLLDRDTDPQTLAARGLKPRMAKFFGLHAVGWHVMTENWWDIVLAAFVIFGVASGTAYAVFFLARKAWRHHVENKNKVRRVPPAILQYFKDQQSQAQAIGRTAAGNEDPKTFGVYLGNFARPPTPKEASLLRKWDVIVFDPFQPGVYEAVLEKCTSSQILGRIDIAQITKLVNDTRDDYGLEVLKMIVDVLNARFRTVENMQSPFTAVLLANWHPHLPPVICRQLLLHLRHFNFDVYLEASEPEYLTDEEVRHISMDLIRGLICRNGTIKRNGDRRDYYQMAHMRRAQRGLAKHIWQGGIVFAMWETLDNGITLPHSVAKRSSLWCRFNTALSWIGSEAALTDVGHAADETLNGDPLGALMWMKTNETMAMHDTWRLNDRIARRACHEPTDLECLDDFVPDLKSKLRLHPWSNDTSATTSSECDIDASFSGHFTTMCVRDPLAFSPSGEDYTGLGCFQTGLIASQEAFSELVGGQRRLRELSMLQRLGSKDLRHMGEELRPLLELSSRFEETGGMFAAIEELLDLLAVSTGDATDRLRVWVGIHSGFHRGTHEQFWGLYDFALPPAENRRMSDPDFSYQDIYLSLRAVDRASTLLHTWLSSRQFTRTQCLRAEQILGEHKASLHSRWKLPFRLVQDIEGLTSQELLLLTQDFSHAVRGRRHSVTTHHYVQRIQGLCNFHLMEIPTRDQLRVQNTESYLQNKVSVEDVIRNRLAWYQEQGCDAPSFASAVEVFKAVDSRVPQILMNQETELFGKLEALLQRLVRKDQIDAAVDMLALAVFCAFRKLAVEEVYLEVLDRNPLPNRHPDQAACFAEMFGTGSQCETYFDMTSNVLGKILADKYQKYYMEFQPPTRKDGSRELPTSYASKNVDEDPDAHRPRLPAHYQITFLGIFAVPALVDILFLTFLGRGLYLSDYMSETEKIMATAGLMAGLVLCGGVGTWIGYGGSYYLHAMAFPAMNMFVITRFVAGLAILSFFGFFAFIIIGAVTGFYGAFIFLFYFCALDTYLTLLATLAIYQFPGFKFQSGRTMVVTCIPILLISPITTLWIGHEIIVYPCVVSGFLVCLILGTRRIVAQWGTWYLRVPTISDTEVVNYYTKVTPEKDLPDIADLAATPLPRQTFFAALEKERKRMPWQKSEADDLIKKHAAGYDGTVFLMDWYCKYSRTAMPYPYSPTWNLMVKTAIDTLKDMQKGLKLHNAFIHWRFGGDEVWCGVLYFLIALMDKWVSLVTGRQVTGLINSSNPIFRLAIGLSLAYYLISAVFLDSVAQPLWPKANKKTDQQVPSLKLLHHIAVNDAKARRKLYWSNWLKFFLTHVWAFALTSAMLWTFEAARPATIMYMAYIGAYSGLLFYQYNRIYGGPLNMNNLIIAAVLGITVGPIIRVQAPGWLYASVTALATSTWTACILSWRTAQVGGPLFLIFDREKKHKDLSDRALYSSSSFGFLPEFSQRTLAEMFLTCESLPSDERMRIDPSTWPGSESLSALRAHAKAEKPKHIQQAFPDYAGLLNEVAKRWSQGEVVVDLVSDRLIMEDMKKTLSIARTTCDRVHIMVFCGRDLDATERSQRALIIAERIVKVVLQVRLGYSREYASLAEMLLVHYAPGTKWHIPQGIRRHLKRYASERARVIRGGDAEVLRSMLFGVEVDIEWHLLPEGIRRFLLERSVREHCAAGEEQSKWMLERYSKDGFANPEQAVAFANLSANLASSIRAYAISQGEEYVGDYRDLNSTYERFRGPPIPLALPRSLSGRIGYQLRNLYKTCRFIVKFFVIATTAEPEFQRELDFIINDKPAFIRWPALIVLNGLWLYCKNIQSIIVPLFMFHNREDVALLRTNMKGIKATMRGDRVNMERAFGPWTGFLKTKANGVTRCFLYCGRYDKQPEGRDKLKSISTFTYKQKRFQTKVFRLTRREVYNNTELENAYTYEYGTINGKESELPMSRECVHGECEREILHYDARGYITSGSYFKDDNLIMFKYFYRRNAHYDDELLRAVYTLSHIYFEVSWCYPPPVRPEELDRWIPNPKVTKVKFVQGADVYHCEWNYDHRSHPTISCTKNGAEVDLPPLIKHDWYGILQKPKYCSFMSDNPLMAFKNSRSNSIIRLFHLNTKWFHISTSVARNHLWRTWKQSKDLDAVSVRWLDEQALRQEPVLRKYWLRRDMGLLRSARAYYQEHADAVLARTDLDPDISSWSSIATRFGDLESFGQGGDTRINTRSEATQIQDTDEKMHVLAMDTGTWPNEAGGVSACRRDMVNDLSTIRWHVIAENANDFGVPKFQTERNIQSLTVLPLWGLDFLTPNHGVFRNVLDSAIQRRSNHTRDLDIRRNFLPILSSLVKCARAINFTRQHVEEASRAFVDLSNYFEKERHWTETWMSEPVKQKWRELWLAEDVENAVPISQWWKAEHPTLAHLDNALDMWHRFLFIFTLPVPERIPDVFQASHHFAGASYGFLCKLKRNVTLHVWDHCISWREVTVFLASAMSFDAPFVCTSLIQLSRMTSVLILHYADVVLPCADFFNPGWEIEHGTQYNTLMHRKQYARKIDPVVNGICNMEKFIPIKKIKSKIPTVTMLSHVRFVKDIKNAILAADIIVNEWGFKDYQLDIYGDMEKAPAYSVECKEILASKGLRDHVSLKGLGSPSKVLEEAWIFLNSSVSEGLPLAMGEAALTGVPVVCTDVGASFRVVTDPVTWKKFSAVVAPNDSYSLAKAQINVLALLDEWAEFAEDPPGPAPKLSLHPTKEEVAMITKRMYEKEEQRHKLGMMGRTNVLNSFSSDRYLREHEQMLWIGKCQSPAYLAKRARSAHIAMGSEHDEDEKNLELVQSGSSPEGSQHRFGQYTEKSAVVEREGEGA